MIPVLWPETISMIVVMQFTTYRINLIETFIKVLCLISGVLDSFLGNRQSIKYFWGTDEL